MLRDFLKILLIGGIVYLVWLFIPSDGICQEMTNSERLLTEIRVDVRYIKTNIEELKMDFRSVQGDIHALERRILNMESKTQHLEKIVCDIESINKWFLGILSVIIGGLVLYQYRRASIFRSDDRV